MTPEISELVHDILFYRGVRSTKPSTEKLELWATTLQRLSERIDEASRVMHASDCAVNNGPALPIGPCDCGAVSREDLIEALRPFAWYFDVNDCKDRSEDDALEVPIRNLRVAFEIFEALGLSVKPIPDHVSGSTEADNG